MKKTVLLLQKKLDETGMDGEKRKELKQLWDRLVLHFDVANQVVSTVEMYEKNGDHTIIQMQDVVVNKPVDAKIFNVE